MVAPPDSALNLILTIPLTSKPTNVYVYGAHPLNVLFWIVPTDTQPVPSFASICKIFVGFGWVVLKQKKSNSICGLVLLETSTGTTSITVPASVPEKSTHAKVPAGLPLLAAA